MKSPKDYLLLVLAASTLGCAALAWRQYDELLALRAAAMNGNERAEWQKRLWDADKRRTALEDQLVKLEHEGSPDRGGALPAAEQSGPRGNRRQDRAGEFMAMMDKPEIQRLVALQQRGALDARYAALFKNLSLTPEQLEKFKNLLVEKQTSMMDVLAAARAQGINPRTDPTAFRQLFADAQGEIDSSIKSAIGDAGYAQYKNYEQTQPQRNTVGELAQRLSYSQTPLTPSQSEQMVAILASNTAPKTGGDAGGARAMMFAGALGGPAQFAGAGGTARINDATVNQAQGVLTGPQLDALRQLQQEQEAQAQLAKAMRNQFAPPPNSGSTATPAPKITPKPPAAPGGG